jgi:hypothetical protein
MPSLSANEIRSYASKAGFTGADLDIAVAVAMAESGGNTTAHNGKGKDDSYGLWQINMYGAMGPDRRKQFGLTSNEQLYDPTINAKAAYAIHKSQGWARGWTTYGTKNYKEILQATKGGKDLKSAVIQDSPLEEVTGVVDKVPDAINAFGSTLFKSATNLTGVLIAVAFLVIGIVLLAVSSKTATKAINVAANVVPGGTAVKGAIKGAVKK